MNFRQITLTLLILVQLGWPLQIIYQYESVFKHGQLYRFKIQPVDLVDPFQGRYIKLSTKEHSIRLESKFEPTIYNSWGYASIAVDPQGFAYFDQWHSTPPDNQTDYIRTKSLGYNKYEASRSKRLRIEIPYDSFYVQKTKEPRPERINHEVTHEQDSWANVRIYKGKVAIEDVFVKGQSLNDLTTVDPKHF